MAKNTSTTARKAPAKRAPRRSTLKIEPVITVQCREFERVINRIKAFAGDDLTPSINSVVIEYHKGVLSAFATDRFTMGCNIIAHDTDPDNRPDYFKVVVRLADVALLLAAVKRVVGDRFALKHRDGRLIVDGVSVGDPDLIDTYPKYRHLLENAVRESGTPDLNAAISMNPVYLRRFAQIKPTPIMRVSTATKPIVVVSENFIGMLMPVREVGSVESVLARLGIDTKGAAA